MADVDDGLSSFGDWSWEENKQFEMALAMIDEDNPERWKEIASMIGGKKSVKEVKRHYEALLEDLDIIESGRLDQEFGKAQDCTQHDTWTDDDHKMLKELHIVQIASTNNASQTARFLALQTCKSQQMIYRSPPS